MLRILSNNAEILRQDETSQISRWKELFGRGSEPRICAWEGDS